MAEAPFRAVRRLLGGTEHSKISTDIQTHLLQQCDPTQSISIYTVTDPYIRIAKIVPVVWLCGLGTARYTRSALSYYLLL